MARPWFTAVAFAVPPHSVFTPLSSRLDGMKKEADEDSRKKMEAFGEVMTKKEKERAEKVEQESRGF